VERQALGIREVKAAPRSPWQNAYAERFVLSAKSECLERIVSLGQEDLRAAVREFVDHYHEERPHQGLGNELIAPQAKVIGTGPLKCRERLGGVLTFY
jgi:transposase InsO family protein